MLAVQRITAPLVLALAFLAAAEGAAAFPTTGTQRLLVIPVEYQHGDCQTLDPATSPSCPRQTAAGLGTVIQNGLNEYYGNAATGSRTSWQVRTLVDPTTANGWWAAPSTTEQLVQRQKTVKNWNHFTASGSEVRDAAEVIVARALDRGVITPSQLAGVTRLVAVHNWAFFGGQAWGSSPLTYRPPGKFIDLTVTAAWINEDTGNGRMLRVLTHELGHQLGPRDLYGQPCSIWPPGEPEPLEFASAAERERRTECMGTWDVMGLTGDRNPAFTYFTRAQLGWATGVSPELRTEPGSFSGRFSLSSLEYPNGDPIALHIPDDPSRLILARAFGNASYFQGFLAECRRTPANDPIAPPGQGLVISYVDSTAPDRKIVVARRSDELLARQDIDLARLRPGSSFTSLGRGFNLRYEAALPNPKGGCQVFLNKPPLGAKAAAFVPAVTPDDPTRALQLGRGAPAAVWSNPGVLVGGPVPPKPDPRFLGRVATAAATRAAVARTLARRPTAITPVRRGAPTTIRFAYGNGGEAAGGGEAVVRVQQPWVPQARCGATAVPAGRVVGRLRLPSLPPAGAGTAALRWTPRSDAPAAISVTLKGAGRPAGESETTTSVVGFATLRAVRRGSRPQARLRLTLSASRACRGTVPYVVSPTILPRGWSAVVTGSRALKPGGRAPVSVLVRGPRSARGARSAIALEVRFGGGRDAEPADVDAVGPLRVPQLDEAVGIDLLTRAPSRSGALPSFLLPPPAGLTRAPAPTPLGTPGGPFDPGVPPEPEPPGQPPPSAALTPQSVQVDACTQPIPGNGVAVSVDGTISPARAGVSVKLTYTSAGEAPPAGTVIERSVSTNAAGGFSDTFDRQSAAWSVVASVAADPVYAAATAAACAVPIP